MKTKLLITTATLVGLAIGMALSYWLLLFGKTQSCQNELCKYTKNLGSCPEMMEWLQDFSYVCPYCRKVIQDGRHGHEYERYEGPDPSLNLCMEWEGKKSKWYRFVADFDGDGLEDIALITDGEDYEYASKNGYEFCLYLQTTNRVYREAGSFFADLYVSSIQIVHIKDDYLINPIKAQLWQGCWIAGKWDDDRDGYGWMSCKEIDHEGNLSWDAGMSLYDFRLFQAVFNKLPNTVPVRLEYSDSTNALGEAVWVLLDSYTPPKDEPENPPAAEEE